MRRFITVLCAASICMVIGCEKKYPRGEGRTGFDQKIDGPVNALKTPADDNLLADQGKISREFETDEALPPPPAAAPTPGPEPAPGPAPGPAPAASGKSVNQVKRLITRMAAAAAKPREHAKLPGFFVGADATLIRPLTTGDPKNKATAFLKLTKTTLGVKLPGEVDGMIRGMTKPPPLQDIIGHASKYRYEQVGETIVATGPSGEQFTFVQVGSTWKAKLSAEGKDRVTVLKAIQDAAIKFLDEATAGVKDGSITRQTVEGMLQELQKKHLGGLKRAAPPARPPGQPEPGF